MLRFPFSLLIIFSVVLIRSSLSTQAPYLIKDINTNLVSNLNPSSSPSSWQNFGPIVFFAASTPATGRELYWTLGTPGSSKVIKDIAKGPASPAPQELTPLGTKILFSAKEPTHGRELWITDGTSGGTKLLKDIGNLNSSSFPSQLTRVGKRGFHSQRSQPCRLKGLLYSKQWQHRE
jgi:ELWxxDGT repeat protein